MGLLNDSLGNRIKAISSLFKNSKRAEMKTISDREKEIILSIHAYEDSVVMPEDERLTTLVGKPFI